MPEIQTPDKKKSRLKPSLFRFIGLILYGVILLKLDLREILVTLSGVRIVFLPAILVLYYFTLAVKSLRWMAFFERQNLHLSFGKTFQVYLYSAFLGLATVGQAIDLSKAYLLKKQAVAKSRARGDALSLGQAGMSVFLERLMELGIYLFAGTAGIIFLRGYSSGDSLELSLGMFIVFYLVAAYLFLFHSRSLLKLSGKLGVGKDGVTGWFFKNLKDFLEEIDLFPKKDLARPLLLTFVSYLTQSFIVLLLAMMLKIEITYLQALLLYPLIFLANILPVTVGGFGTRDLVLYYWFSHSGVPAESLVAFSIMYFSVDLLALAVPVPFISFSQKTPKE